MLLKDPLRSSGALIAGILLSFSVDAQSIVSSASAGCLNATVSYSLSSTSGIVSTPSWSIVSGAGSMSSVQGSATTVSWRSSGTVQVSFPILVNGTVVAQTRTASFTLYSGGTVSGPSSVCAGESGTLTVSGAPSGTQVWQSCTSGCASITDTGWSTMSGGSFTNLTTSTSFRVKVTVPSCGVVYSDVKTVTVKPYPAATISPTGTLKICSTCSQQCPCSRSIQASGGTSYQWKKDGVDITGALSATYSANQPGSYTAAVTLDGCTKISPALVLVKNVLPVANAGPDKTIVLPENTVTLIGSGTDSDGTIVSYTWTKVSGPPAVLSGTPPATITLSDLVYGTYVFALVVKDDSGESSLPDQVTITVAYPPNNYNWIKETTVQVEGKKTDADVSALQIATGQKSLTWNYFDGLGRKMQSLNVQGSPLAKDVVQAVVYDAFNREKVKYLPYVSSDVNGYYKVNPVGTPDNNSIPSNYSSSPHGKFYNNATTDGVVNDPSPYAVTIFEPSPLNRVIEQGAPGSAWQPDGADSYGSADRTIKQGYETNAANEVLLWSCTYPTGSASLARVNAGTAASPIYYAAGDLYLNRSRDEEYHETIEYKDKHGQVILKKVEAAPGVWAETYHIYDIFGNLVCVIPPQAVSKLATDYHHATATAATKENFLRRWTFRYKYDARRRMIQKQVPGAGQVLMVYDDRDRLVLTQDSVQRFASPRQWEFTKYDELNQPIATGIKDTAATLTQAQMQGVVNNFYATKTWARFGERYTGTDLHGYTNVSYPVVTSGATINPNSYHSVSYYDNYAHRENLYNSAAYQFKADDLPGEQKTNYNERLKNQVTGTRVRVLDGGGYTWLNSVLYYDDEYRVIQSIADNYKGGIDRTTNVLDFTGKIRKTKVVHTTYDVCWKEHDGAIQTGNRLVRTNSTNGWGQSGAASVQQLAAGQNGWMEAIVSETNTNRMIGLSDANVNTDFNTIDYALYLNASTLSVRENGVAKTTFTGTLSPGDVVRIERTGTTITYRWKNNVYTSLVPSTTLLMADASIYTTGGSLAGVRASFAATSNSVTRAYIYDHANRLKEVWHAIDGATAVKIIHNQYNELGQLMDKKLHSTLANASDAKQSVDYRYNIRGWLTSVNNATLTDDDDVTNDDTGDYFGMNLAYNVSDPALGNTARYNGNISGMTWSKYLGLGDVKQHGYVYAYDAMNRLSTATHKALTAPGTWTAGQYDESGLTYDLNGNITHLDRKGDGGVQIDNLTYNYGTGITTGNKLLYVQDNTTDATHKAQGFRDGNTGTATDYTYDLNGNLTRDLNKGVGTSLTDASNLIKYNFLNLPETITKDGSSIRYIYDAVGRKLAQVVTSGTSVKQTDYAGEFIYENDVLQFINHDEGRVVVAKSKLLYINGCDTLNAAMTAVNATLSVSTANGEKYVTATATGTAAGTGIFPFAGTIAVTPGARYRIRAKGYRGTSVAYLQVKAGAVLLNSTGAALPASATAETWVEQIVTIPAGQTTLQAGVTWTSVTVGETLYLNDFEITRLESTTPEYQYHLKDHLGNVHLTFTTKDETDLGLATLETVNAGGEEGKFLYYNEAVKINHQIWDHTNLGGTSYATRLTGGNTDEIYGLTKTLSVMPGDKVNLEVYAKYLDPVSGHRSTALNNFIISILNGTAPQGTFVDGGAAGSIGDATFPIDGIDHSSETGEPPKAYLNYILFDRAMNTVLDLGFQRITTNSREYGQDASHDRLAFDGPNQILIKEPGYMYIYLSNENETNVEVYFDDFRVEHIKSPVVQVDDYYPYGLPYNSSRRENSSENSYLYNDGSERQDELAIDVDATEFRMYDPALGRWWQVDPLSDEDDLIDLSPYNYSYNNPVRYNDPKGDKGRPGRPAAAMRYQATPAYRTVVHSQMIRTSYKYQNRWQKQPGGKVEVGNAENPQTKTGKWVKIMMDLYGDFKGYNDFVVERHELIQTYEGGSSSRENKFFLVGPGAAKLEALEMAYEKDANKAFDQKFAAFASQKLGKDFNSLSAEDQAKFKNENSSVAALLSSMVRVELGPSPKEQVVQKILELLKQGVVVPKREVRDLPGVGPGR